MIVNDYSLELRPIQIMKRDDRRNLTLALILFLATHFYSQFNSWMTENVLSSRKLSSGVENSRSSGNGRYDTPIGAVEAKVAIEVETVISMTWKYSNHTYILGYPESISYHRIQ